MPEISDITQSFRVFKKDNESQGTATRNINSESAYKDFFPSPQQMTKCERKDYIYS